MNNSAAQYTRNKSWRVVRHVREEYEVQAASRAEALANVQDPHSVTVVSETCVAIRKALGEQPQ